MQADITSVKIWLYRFRDGARLRKKNSTVIENINIIQRPLLACQK